MSNSTSTSTVPVKLSIPQLTLCQEFDFLGRRITMPVEIVHMSDKISKCYPTSIGVHMPVREKHFICLDVQRIMSTFEDPKWVNKILLHELRHVLQAEIITRRYNHSPWTFYNTFYYQLGGDDYWSNKFEIDANRFMEEKSHIDYIRLES